MTITTVPVTAAMLYDLVACPHRVTLDISGDPTKRDAPNPFVELLWERGSLYEQEVIAELKIPFLNLSSFTGEERERLTLEAMQRGEALIYGGRIRADDLLGDPDLLRKEPDGYIAGDIKSGSGEEGEGDDSKPKKHYAVQLGLYTDILERKGLSAGRHAFVWDVHGAEVVYDFQLPVGTKKPRTLWQDYQEALQQARAIIEGEKTIPAFSSICKHCHWHSICVEWIRQADDLTMIPELGRSKRDAIFDTASTVAELAKVNPEDYIDGKKTTFPGIGPDSLWKFHHRAKLLIAKDPVPFLRAPIVLADHELELFFDIEVDPMRDICYLHGFVERRGRNDTTEKFIFFFAEDPTPKAEKRAFTEAWDFMKTRRPCAIYYYSKYERTIYRKLQEKYPDVCTAEEIEDLFDPANAIDLYFDIVKRATEWPTWDQSIKTLAKYLGFSWRDTHPSGAASIEWFDKWVRTRQPEMRQRILDYNEDDCRATRVLRDGIEQLKPLPSLLPINECR